MVQLYVTDDDIVQTSASISRSFALMQQYGLLLAQPSLCSPFESATWQNPLYKDARLILQYTTFVEIMVPMFNMNFFTSKVIATLEHAETGMPLTGTTFRLMTRLHMLHVLHHVACALLQFSPAAFVVITISSTIICANDNTLEQLRL